MDVGCSVLMFAGKVNGMLLVSPAEPKSLREALALEVASQNHALPEQVGADFVFSGAAGLIGVQRKSYPADLAASVRDGRLQREAWLLLDKCEIAVLLLEGNPFDPLSDPALQRWTIAAMRNLMLSMQLTGIATVWTADTQDTIDWLKAAMEYFKRAEHQSLLMRPKGIGRNGWGVLDTGSLLLQSFPGVGPKVAAAILEKFGGVPVAWTCSEEEMAEVEGVGKKTVEKLFAVLDKEAP